MQTGKMTACSLPTEAVEGFSFHHSHLWLRLLCLRPPAKKGSKHVHSKFENLGQHRCAKSKLLFGREFDSRAGVLKFRWKFWQRICICQRFLTQHMIETWRNSIGSIIIPYPKRRLPKFLNASIVVTVVELLQVRMSQGFFHAWEGFVSRF